MVKRDEHSLGRGRKGPWKQRAQFAPQALRNWWDTVSVHTYSMKASIQKKIGALWPSRQHCHKNNGQRLVVNKFVLENISILFTQGEDRKK